ncbi:MAG: hypothetical protein J6R68_06465 [Clostridia bacterium]|nr:hypothetical protein [Clostridia bacterium]
MAIKMRINKDIEAKCCECGAGKKQSLNLFDIKIANHVFTLCDECNLKLFYKTLNAECHKNHRTKTPEDMAILRKRAFIAEKQKIKEAKADG